MNRIRHAYSEIVPGLEPYFVSGFHDDARGVLATYGSNARPSTISSIFHGLTTTIGMVATIDAMIVGALGAVIAVALGGGLVAALLLAVIGFLAGFAAFAVIGQRSALGGQARAESRFPTPGGPGR
jgi:hypothetical protein